MTCPTQSHNIGIVAETVCPKCGEERRPGADACRRCGLLVSRWATFKKDILPAVPVLDALWAKLEADWENDALHARFLDEAATLGSLDLAAARYRARLRRGDDPRAQAGLDRAVRLVLQLHKVEGPDPALGTAARLVKFAGIFIAVVLFVATVWVMWAALGRR